MKRKTTGRRVRKIIVPSECYFCKEKIEPWYSDTSNLRKFVTERGKIKPRSHTGLCSKHQRRLTLAIKHARHIALLPFVSKE